jgi:hydroxymethylpyrimidine/phosphomethylpyrimidine kinase
MSFNVSDPSGAGGSAGDVATIAAMGAHALPVITSIVMRDTAEIFDHHPIEADLIVEQARSVLEDVTIAAWKVGFSARPRASAPSPRSSPTIPTCRS